MKANVVLLANKWWEAVTLVSVLEHARAIKPGFSACPSAFETISRRPPQECVPEVRLRCRIDERIVDVLCIEDLIGSGKSSSSSIEKQRALTSLFARGTFDNALVIAFGTAASPDVNCAGNVVIGSKVFVFDASEHKDTPELATFSCGIGEVVDSAAGTSLLGNFGVDCCFEEAQKRFLSPPNNPSPHPQVFAGPAYVSVGVINVLRSEEYKHFDALALMRFSSVKKEGQTTQSVETTHGLIRLCVDSPFLYVSGIANQVGNFEEEVSPNQYSQNFTASHNAAICVAWMLPQICRCQTS